MPEGLLFAVYLGQVYMVSVLLIISPVSGQLNKEDGDDYLISDQQMSLFKVFPHTAVYMPFETKNILQKV